MHEELDLAEALALSEEEAARIAKAAAQEAQDLAGALARSEAEAAGIAKAAAQEEQELAVALARGKDEELRQAIVESVHSEDQERKRVVNLVF